MNDEKIIERLAALEVKVDMALDLLREHRANHAQYNLLCWGALLSAAGAIVVAILV